MCKLPFLIVIAAASFPLAAQQQDQRSSGTEQQQTRSGQNTQNAATPPSDAAVDRTRNDGAAGGTKPVPEDKRRAVGAGAGPHLHDQRPGMQQNLPHDKPVEPSK